MYTLFRILKNMKKNILITWTSKWIWYFLANKLSKYNDIFCISRSKCYIDWVCEFNIDLTNYEVFDNLCKKLEQDNIKLDTIILNAWVWYFGSFFEWEEKDYFDIINLNLSSNIVLLKKLEKFLHKKSKIIFMWSIISKKFMKYWAVYQASKFGLRWFAGALKSELSWNRVHIINPKIVDTKFHDNSKISLSFDSSKYTSMESIYEVVNNIIESRESRFEIDL